MQYQQSKQHEIHRNQELLTRSLQFQEQEARAEEQLSQQAVLAEPGHHQQEAARERGQPGPGRQDHQRVLKGRISELHWSLMDQEMRVKCLESDKQLQEQLDLQHKKWQEADQKIQELQATRT
ncbi:hypothetical protein P7K49_000794 [Saguinus oedipus]|uniref:Uncharacterized protein n=1 Tax=Saguinus oedipus TaxID=9490 RepID=A0ABQ9WFA1_SAGOE|nr:hypothetical protein P7K49_000794 [Saguinus oedipus]